MHGVIHMEGVGEDDFPTEKFPKLYDELFDSGIFDGSVSVINDDNGWSILAHRNKRNELFTNISAKKAFRAT